MNKKFGKSVSTLLILILMNFLFVSCGVKKESESDVSTEELNREFVYVPTFTSVEVTDAAFNVGDGKLQEDKLYYSLNTYSSGNNSKDYQLVIVEVNDLSKLLVMDVKEPEVDGYRTTMNGFQIDSDGNMYVLYESTAENSESGIYGEEDYTTYLVKYDCDGNIVYEQDLKSLVQDKNNAYIQSFQISNDGKLYAACNNVLYVLGVDGTLQNSISTNTEWIQSLIKSGDGRLFYSQACNTGDGIELIEIDTSKDTAGATYKNVPEMSGLICGSSDGKLLIRGSTYLYEYDTETQLATPVLDWADSNIVGDYVVDMMKLQGDNFLLLYKDPIKGGAEIIKLTKTKSSEIPEKEVIVFASFYSATATMDRAIDDFNKRSSQYKIVKKKYYDDSKIQTQELYDDSLTLMYTELTGDNPPDIIDLSQLNTMALTKQGVLEDLSSYLENSSILSKDDFVSAVLNAYTLNDKLVTIPRVFYINTVMAKTSLVGDKPGWMIEDMIRLQNTYPEAQLFAYMSKQDALKNCILYNSSAFVDYENGSCSFNSEDFLKVLEFANGFNDNSDYNDDINVVEQIQQNNILLNSRRLGSISSYQIDLAMFGEPLSYIGYPTSDGSNGAFIEGMETYGITAHSTHKEGAWAFLENYLQRTSEDVTTWTFFSGRQDELEVQFDQAMSKEFVYREMKIPAASQEQVKTIRKLIEEAKRPNENDEAILQIINEEAAAYFTGQKSAKDVADIIQSRVSILVSENS